MASPPISRPRVIHREGPRDVLPMPVPPAMAERFPLGLPAHPGDLPAFGSGTPTLWSGGTKFPSQGFETGCALWAALAAKMAYVTTGATLNTYAEKIGATSVTKVAFDDPSNQVPRGLKIVYPEMVLWVIQGTTRWEQIAPMINGLRYRAVNVTGDPALDASGNFSWVFRFFYDVSTAWLNLIDQWLLTQEGQKPFMIIGHSLGAGVLTPLLMRLEKNQPSLWDSGMLAGGVTRPADKYPAFNFRGGYTFGSPKTRAQRRRDDMPTYAQFIGRDDRLNNVYTQRMWWARLTRSVLNFTSPLDPIGWVPDALGNFPAWAVVGNMLFGEFGPRGDFVPHWTDYREGRVHRQEVLNLQRGNGAAAIRFPSSIRNFKERLEENHFASFYIASLREVIRADGHGDPTGEWTDLLDWVEAQAQEDKITESFTP